MTSSPTPAILAIDIGATSIKVARVDDDGHVLERARRRATPYPCPPERLVSLLARRITRSGLSRVGVGFPGEFRDGVVVRPGNLSRSKGIASAVDPDLERRWEGFALQTALRDATGCDVRVVNDATLAALGCALGRGRELVLTLGTGLGLALMVDGAWERVRDVGAAPFLEGRTYDEALGERGRAADETRWRTDLRTAVAGFAAEFATPIVHLAGGNARRVSPSWFEGLHRRVIINGNEAPLRGAARLFQPLDVAGSDAGEPGSVG